MLFSNLFIILLNVVLVSTVINDSKKTQLNDTENEIRGERITGGIYTNEEVPYQVALIDSDGNFGCGGSLLKTDVLENRVIVTAASCVTGYDFDLKFILNFANHILKYKESHEWSCNECGKSYSL
jgi:secreted trypsin-like serine protease